MTRSGFYISRDKLLADNARLVNEKTEIAKAHDHLRRIILGLFNPMPDGHEKGCLHNDPHIHPRGPCICRYSEVAAEYLWALREARAVAAAHFDKQEVETSYRLKEPRELVDAAATRS